MSDSVLHVTRQMNRLALTFLLTFSLSAAAQTSPQKELFDAAMTRDVPAEKYVWNWRDAVLLKAFTDIYRADPQRRELIADYVDEAMTRVAPKAHGVHPNGVASAVGLAFLQEIGRSSMDTDKALARVMMQCRNIVRSAGGACSHRAGTVELWDDTVYMIGMALIGSYKATGDLSYVEEFAGQVIAHAEHLYDHETGFWYHGWAETSFPAEDACSLYGWNTNRAHRNNEFWGRGNGWIAMSLADVLEVLPSSDVRYPEIKAMYEKMMNTLVKLQDRRTGLWRQLPLHVRDKANFLESSGTAMFGYALAKGVRIGVLPADCLKTAQKAYDGLVKHCLLDAGTPQVRLGRICAGTCIGDKEYYYARSQVDRGETYAVGAFLLLANELATLSSCLPVILPTTPVILSEAKDLYNNE